MIYSFSKPASLEAHSAHRPRNPDHWSKRDTLQILGRKCDPELSLAIQYYLFPLNFNKG
ncbi:hypothetical protein TNCV_1790311, partial [Trichonephila clavipes]